MKSFEMETSHRTGMGWPKASLFLIGHSAGAGMLAMPLAFSVMGVEIGTILALICAGFSLNTGLQLGWMWLILQKLWPEYRKTCQNPYGEIAYRAFGRFSRNSIEIMICFAQLGYAVVLLLLAAKNASVLAHFFLHKEVQQCYMILIVALFVWPITMLRSPVDFWQIAWISTASSWAAVILIVIGIIKDASTCSQEVFHEPMDLYKSFMSYGSIVFAYAAHPSFPTCQHDMKKPENFSYSLFLTWAVISSYYLIVSYLGYFVYGSSLGDSIISSIQNVVFQQLINLMFAIHVTSTIIIAASPAFQMFEKMLKVPKKFGGKRLILRSVIFLGVTITALSFPHFGPMINLLGASVNSLIAMILPPIFYLSLRTIDLRKNKNKEDCGIPSIKEIYISTPTWIFLFNLISVGFGILAAVIATISAVRTFVDSSLPPPCYIQYIRSELPFSSTNGTVDCCGKFRNVTVSGLDPNGFCSFRE